MVYRGFRQKKIVTCQHFTVLVNLVQHIVLSFNILIASLIESK
uniref:Uncharacterized protein n=1 Tax=Arundo donax TaxID=35708 RepID=A0A0A9FT57_ARUDO